jgi:hypothetical protein
MFTFLFVTNFLKPFFPQNFLTPLWWLFRIIQLARFLYKKVIWVIWNKHGEGRVSHSKIYIFYTKKREKPIVTQNIFYTRSQRNGQRIQTKHNKLLTLKNFPRQLTWQVSLLMNLSNWLALQVSNFSHYMKLNFTPCFRIKSN